MRHVKYFEDFQYQNSDLATELLSGKISEKVYLDIISESLNESFSLSEFVFNLKEKVLNGLFTFLQKAQKVGFKVMDMVMNLVKMTWEKVKKFKEKNPVLFKIITITIAVFLLLILSAASAHAQATGQESGPWSPSIQEKIEMAAGWLKSNVFAFAEGKEEGLKNIKLSVEYLKDLQDGKLDGTYSQRVEDIVNLAIEEVTALKQKSSESKTIADNCVKLLKFGKEILAKTL